ncbi:MAG: type 1 glutamine amidotransferase [Planctomycetes bacterium]|nr:type 1 glutamine amidotransferase [Planctomycetota bacterium]
MTDLKGRRVAILVEDQYQELEVWYPLYRLREAGAQVVTLGTGRKEYRSKLGYPVEADADVHEARGADYDGVVIPGGFAPDFMRRHEGPARFVREAFQAGRVVAAICHGLWIPVSAGILKGYTATCFFAIQDDVVNAGATYVDREVCVDRRLVTARKPDDLPAFVRETIRLLAAR